MSAVVLETTATEILVFRIADCAFRAGGNADPVEITPCFVQYRPARDKLNRLLGANLHTFTTAAAELMVNNDSHNDYLISSCADRQVHILVKSTNSGQGVKAAKKIERNSMQILVFSYLLCYLSAIRGAYHRTSRHRTGHHNFLHSRDRSSMLLRHHFSARLRQTVWHEDRLHRQ